MIKKHSFIFLSFFGLVIAALPAAQTPQAVFEQPMLITSAGQSSGDAQIALQLTKRAGLAAVLSKSGTGKDLENQKTLVLVLGASMKGLGAAGLDTNKEKERIRELVAQAKKKGVPILAMHLGGGQRRGELTDEIVNEFLPSAKTAIILKSGNADGLFTKICKDKAIPLIEIDKSLDAVEPLKKIFK